jgi:hypothetical protein
MQDKKCQYINCGQEAGSSCDNCDVHFCDEHGTKGGDHETGYGLFAYPSVCWKCGGYNADA